MTENILTTIRMILADVSEVERPYEVGPGDDLLALGLTSLETVRMLLQIEERLDIQVPDEIVSQDLFRSVRLLQNTIANLLARDAPNVHEPR